MRIPGPREGMGFLAVSVAIGFFLGIGIRSGTHQSSRGTLARGSGTPAPHHQSPGHESHAHGVPGPEEEATTRPQGGPGGSGHEGHQSTSDALRPPQQGDLLIDLGNENCPIMGNPVDGKTYSTWNNLRIGHC